MTTNVENIRKEKLGRRWLACVDHTGPYMQNAELFARLFNQVGSWAGPKGLMARPGMEAISVYYDDPKKVAPEKHRISVGFTVPEGTTGTEGIRIMELPEGSYVVGSFTITPAQYESSWNEVFSFMGAEGLQPAPGPMYESYRNDPGKDPDGKHVVDICIRVQD